MLPEGLPACASVSPSLLPLGAVVAGAAIGLIPPWVFPGCCSTRGGCHSTPRQGGTRGW